MAQARLKIGADASQAKKAIKELNDEMGRVDAKGRKLKVGSKSADGSPSKASQAATEKASGNFVGAIGAVTAAAASAAGALMWVANMAKANREERGKGADNIDDWTDKGNALGYESSPQGIGAAMALDDVLIASGASPKLADKLISSWFMLTQKLTDTDRQNLGIEGLKGDESLIKVLQNWKTYDPSTQQAMSTELGLDNKRMGVAIAALQAGSNDGMMQDLEKRKAAYAASIDPSQLDGVGARELSLREGEKLKAIYSTSNAEAVRMDGLEGKNEAIRQGKFAGGKISATESALGWMGEVGRSVGQFVDTNVTQDLKTLQWAVKDGTAEANKTGNDLLKSIDATLKKLAPQQTQAEPPKAQ